MYIILGIMINFSISYVLAKHFVSVCNELLRYGTIRRNVDDYFLYSANLKQIALDIQRRRAIAYRVKSGSELLGCLLAFRNDDKLYAHFLFRTYPGVSATELSQAIIPKMVRYYDRRHIPIMQVIGEIPVWNHAAIRVCQCLGARNDGVQALFQRGKNIEIQKMVFEVPKEMHLVRKKRSDGPIIDSQYL